MEVENKVREMRFNKNQMTQEELAKRLDVSRQTIIAIEQGKFNPSVKLALQMAQVFGCPVEDIFRIRKTR